MASILSRIEAVQRQLDRNGAGKISVTFTDGTKQQLTGGECIDIVFNAPGTVARFEALGTGSGMLPDLLNGLL